MNGITGRIWHGCIAIGAAAMVMSACTTVQPGHDQEAPSMISYFTCSTGEKITIVYSEDRATLYDPAGRRFALRQTAAGSGSLYKGEGHELREKATGLLWTAPRHKPRTCKSKISVPAAPTP